MERQIRILIWTATIGMSIVLLAAVCAVVSSADLQTAGAPPSIAVHFSPEGGIVEADVAAIAGARKEILVHAYSFTSRAICDALIAAKQRGVDVQLVIDKDAVQHAYCRASELVKAKCPVHIATCRGIAHSKVMLIDGRTIVTGSFNWTEQAENVNQENQLILTGYPELMKLYQANWQTCWGGGTPYAPKQ